MSSSMQGVSKNIQLNQDQAPQAKERVKGSQFNDLFSQKIEAKQASGRLESAKDPAFEQRFKGFEQVVKSMLSAADHPYASLKEGVKNEMIQQIATVLAESPRPLPQQKV